MWVAATAQIGRTNNPYDLSRTPGDSSGGSAALVAAGGAALSVGSDGGGSIRQPCHNTIAGIKPTHGRIPRTGSVFDDDLGIFGPFLCYGPLARSVQDLFLGLSIMSGPDLKDPYAVPAPLGSPDEVDLAELRVATYLDDGTSPPSQEVASVVTAAGDAMREVAAIVDHARPGCLGRTMELLWRSVFLGGDRGRGFEEDLRAISATDPSEEPAEFLRQAHEVDFPLTEVRSRLVDVDRYRIEMLSFMADYDVIVCPAMPTPAKPHHHGLVEISDFSHLMAHNLTGWPAALVRCGTSEDGLPIGIQVVARPWQDVTALAVASHFEKVFGAWQPPPLWC